MAQLPSPSLPPALQTWNWVTRPLAFVTECHQRFGDAFALRLVGIGTFAFFRGPEAIKEIFAAPGDVLQLSDVTGDVDVLLGENALVRLDGAAHLRHRRLLLPPFHGERMQSHTEVMQSVTDDAIDRWPAGAPFSLHAEFQAITLQIILRAVFGVDEGPRLRALAEGLTAVVDQAMTVPMLFTPLRVNLGPLSPYGRFLRDRERVDAMLFDEIRRRRAAGGLEARTDVLSMLLQARDEDGQPMSDRELRDELVLLLLAGHESTAGALAWTVERLLAQPEVRTRALDELTRVAQGGRLRSEYVPQLEYLDAVGREVLRFRPVVPVTIRRARTAVTIAGYDLPAGVTVAVNIFAAHRRPESYPDPERFDPERFLRNRYDPYTWLPFGGGTRRCVGNAFAQYEMKVVLATILRRVRLRAAGGGAVRPVARGFTLVPSGGTRVVMEERRPRA